MTQPDDDAVLEILDAGPDAGWCVAPGSRAEYPLVIRNGTDEWHDVEVTIAEPIDWVSVTPARLSLAPGTETRTTVVLTLPNSTNVVAGDHAIRLELHDFEGTRFGQVTSAVNVLPAYRLEMSLTLRGPLMRRDIVDGIVMRCQLLNRGNGECTVRFTVEPRTHVTLQTQPVRVPPGADVAFDIDARWTNDVLPSYPSTVTLHANHEGGEVSASVSWTDIASCLGTALPPAAPAEDFPAILTPPKPAASAQPDVTTKDPSPPQTVQAAAAPEGGATLRVAISGAPTGPRGRRLNPWWPPVERFAGRTVVKLRLIAVLLVAIAVSVLAFPWQEQSAGPTPLRTLTAVSTALGVHPARPRVPSIAALHHAVKPQRSRALGMESEALLPHLSLPPQGKSTVSPASNVHRSHTPPAPPGGNVFSGWISHASSANVKVYDPSHKAWRSFMLLPGFHNVYAAGSHRQVPVSRLRSGSVVRVYYSYVLGMRKAREIDLLIKP